MTMDDGKIGLDLQKRQKQVEMMESKFQELGLSHLGYKWVPAETEGAKRSWEKKDTPVGSERGGHVA